MTVCTSTCLHPPVSWPGNDNDNNDGGDDNGDEPPMTQGWMHFWLPGLGSDAAAICQWGGDCKYLEGYFANLSCLIKINLGHIL